LSHNFQDKNKTVNPRLMLELYPHGRPRVNRKWSSLLLRHALGPRRHKLSQEVQNPPLSLSAPGKAMAPAALTNGAHEHVQFLTVVP
jgi:hypothetical protein